MKLNSMVAEALNKQINNELHASYTYLAMSAYFEGQDLPDGSGGMRFKKIPMRCGFLTLLRSVVRVYILMELGSRKRSMNLRLMCLNRHCRRSRQ